MRRKDNYPRIQKDETLRETASHGSPDYPFCYYEEDIWLFDLHRIDWHWHAEVEFVYLEQGEAELLVGSGRYPLRAGEGAFINAQTIHCLTAEGNTRLPNIVFLPSLLAAEESLIYRNYLLPVLNAPVECLILSPSEPRQREALDTLREIFALQEEEGTELRTVELLLGLWRQICQLTRRCAAGELRAASAQARGRMQIMMQYIHAHYQEKLTLEEIARSVSLSKSSVLSLFQAQLHTSPVSYLIEYRLKRAARLLSDTENSVSAIALAVGFDSASYFSRQFKALYGLTPAAYRKAKIQAI